MSSIDGYERVTAPDAATWRSWLEANHGSSPGVWLVFYKKNSSTPSIDWGAAVDEALCFGWIDSKAVSIDQDRYEQYFTRRKRGSPWSKLNKEKVALLESAGRIAPPGWAAIDAAKEDGSWTIMDAAEALIIPEDLAEAFADQQSVDIFRALSPSRQRNILAWIVLAKRPDTRARRIAQTAEAAARGEAPGSF